MYNIKPTLHRPKRLKRYNHKRYTTSKRQDIPDRAKIVIVGAGLQGSLLAFHLTSLEGVDGKHIVMLERDTVANGAVKYASGVVRTMQVCD